MSGNFSTQERLQILRLSDYERRWYSVDDKRVCLICERIISGREIRIDGGPDHYSLGCPTDGCKGNYTNWVIYSPNFAGTPGTAMRGGMGEMDFLPDSEQPELDVH